jgi:hypothetical protein
MKFKPFLRFFIFILLFVVIIFVFLYVIFVLLYVLFVLCRFLYCLCVYMCTVLLPPGGYPIAVKCIISPIFISYFLPYSQEKATILYLFMALNSGQNKLVFLRNDNTVCFL